MKTLVLTLALLTTIAGPAYAAADLHVHLATNGTAGAESHSADVEQVDTLAFLVKVDGKPVTFDNPLP